MATRANSISASEILDAFSPDLATAAVPKRRFFTNADGSPAFRLMLEQFRDELGMWPCGGPRKRVGAYGLRTIAAKLRRLAQREQLKTGWHPLRSVADQFDAIAAERHFQTDDTSRAFSILAMATSRPAVSTRCHNGCHLTDLLNTGKASAADLAASPLALAGAVALNSAGERLLCAARALSAPSVALAA